MGDNGQNQQPWSGPFGMGWQGYLVTAIIILVSALFAASRRDWTSLLLSALVLPLVVFLIAAVVSRWLQDGEKVSARKREPRENMDLITFLARTNPIMFLLFGALSRRSDEERYQQLLRSGPYGMGQQGYLIAILILLAPLTLTLIIIAVTGQQPTHFP